MAGLGSGFQAGAGLNAGLHTDLHLNAHAGVGAGAGYGYPSYQKPMYHGGLTSTGTILVLFILLVIISRSFR